MLNKKGNAFNASLWANEKKMNAFIVAKEENDLSLKRIAW